MAKAKDNAQKVKQQLERLSTMRELEPKEFAYERGLADQLASSFGKDELKPTQLRKIFHALKRVERSVKKKKPEENFDAQDIVLMMPNLAYARGRKLIPEEFYEILKLCLHGRVETNADFLRSVEFIEAVLAYHKYRYPSAS